MPLVQILVTSSTNGSRFSVPVYGKCNITFLGLQYHDSSGGGSTYIASLQSDILTFPQSGLPFLSWVNNPNVNVTFDSGRIQPSLEGVVLNGNIQLKVVNQATGAAPSNFTHLMLNLHVEKIGEL